MYICIYIYAYIHRGNIYIYIHICIGEICMYICIYIYAYSLLLILNNSPPNHSVNMGPRLEVHGALELFW